MADSPTARRDRPARLPGGLCLELRRAVLRHGQRPQHPARPADLRGPVPSEPAGGRGDLREGGAEGLPGALAGAAVHLEAGALDLHAAAVQRWTDHADAPLSRAAQGEGDRGFTGSGGSLEPPGPLPTHLHTVYMAYSACRPPRLNPLAE